MKIREIELQTTDLKGTINFYSNVLGFELIKNEQNLISFLCGESILTFVNSNQNKPNYHFAFNIPNNQINKAKIWLESKVELIQNDYNELITSFESWNAKSIYFYDNNQNIIEFIARLDLKNSTLNEFDTSSVISISEIGIVDDNPLELSKDLISSYSLNYFEKGTQGEEFVSLGDENGMILIAKNQRAWYPTKMKSKKNSVKIKFLVNDEFFELVH